MKVKDMGVLVFKRLKPDVNGNSRYFITGYGSAGQRVTRLSRHLSEGWMKYNFSGRWSKKKQGITCQMERWQIDDAVKQAERATGLSLLALEEE